MFTFVFIQIRFYFIYFMFKFTFVFIQIRFYFIYFMFKFTLVFIQIRFYFHYIMLIITFFFMNRCCCSHLYIRKKNNPIVDKYQICYCFCIFLDTQGEEVSLRKYLEENEGVTIWYIRREDGRCESRTIPCDTVDYLFF